MQMRADMVAAYLDYRDTAELAAAITQSSDQRLKTNVQSLDASSTLALIAQLNPVTFNWIDPNEGNGTQVGFIAQQVQQIFPELVSTTSATALTPDGTLGLNYIGLISPIVSAIQALSPKSSLLSKPSQGSQPTSRPPISPSLINSASTTQPAHPFASPAISSPSCWPPRAAPTTNPLPRLSQANPPPPAPRNP